MLNLSIRDGFASRAEVDAAINAWPAEGWHVYGDHKRVTVPTANLAPPIALLLHRMTTLDLGLIPDIGLWGAGLHEMVPGHDLGWHTDAEQHPHLHFTRARSTVLYLAGDGDLEFRDGALVRPAPGRLVIFDGSAPHRVREVTQLRQSITLFWYDRPSISGTGRTRAAFEEIAT